MVMIVYNEVIDTDVIEILENSNLKNYTKITGVYGRGATSGTHLGSDVWPGRNNILYVSCEESTAEKLLSYIRELRTKLGKEGIKAFSIPIEELT